MVPLTLVVIIVMESTFKPLLQISIRRSMYFVVFCCIFSKAKQSYVYENSLN